MVNIYINNIRVNVPRNVSVLEACEYVGISIPRFCFHERLNVAGNCRMCLVEIEKAPKPVASCAFPISENMKVYTDTPLVHKARENVLEFLLINHPLDCPICDQGGECDLQEQTLSYGSDRSRFFFPKRGVEDKNCGPLIKTIMTRCIHCTRCVRFFQEVCGSDELGTTARGKETEIGTYIQKNLNSELSGNIIDLCPVGALTSKPYAFTARPWELKSVDTIDVTDGVGSNIKINFKETEIVRILPRVNDSINDEWISDKTRFIYDSFKLNRIGFPYVKRGDSFSKSSWKQALVNVKNFIQKSLNNGTKPTDVIFVAGSLLDLETLGFVKQLALQLNSHFIKEENLVENDLLCLSRSNVSMKNLEKADLILTVGSNPRFEASMYDMKIKARSRSGLFKRASIGVKSDLTYFNNSLGVTFKTLFEILEGRHSFCKSLVLSKNPVLVFNSNIYKLLDISALSQILCLINKNCKIISDDWFGLDVLTPVPNVSEFNNSYFTNLRTDTPKLVYLIGVNNSDFIKKNVQTTFIQQSPVRDEYTSKATVVLPSTLFTEKFATFINLENRVQKTALVNNGPGISKSDLEILSTAQHLLKVKLETNTFHFLPVEDNKMDFLKKIIKNDKKTLTKIPFSIFKASVMNFFSFNNLSKNSLILNKCAKIAKANYSNF